MLPSKILHILLDSVDSILSVSMIQADLFLIDLDARRLRQTVSFLCLNHIQHANNYLAAQLNGR